MDIILSFLAKPLDKHGITLVHITYPPLIASVLLWLLSTVGDSFSTVEVVQYSGDNISTVGDNISTVEGIQYCRGIPSVLWGDNSSTCEG